MRMVERIRKRRGLLPSEIGAGKGCGERFCWTFCIVRSEVTPVTVLLARDYVSVRFCQVTAMPCRSSTENHSRAFTAKSRDSSGRGHPMQAVVDIRILISEEGRPVLIRRSVNPQYTERGQQNIKCTNEHLF